MTQQIADMRSEHQQAQETEERLRAEYETAYKDMCKKRTAWLKAKGFTPMTGDLKAS